jgi:hypothetical protein
LPVASTAVWPSPWSSSTEAKSPARRERCAVLGADLRLAVEHEGDLMLVRRVGVIIGLHAGDERRISIETALPS